MINEFEELLQQFKKIEIKELNKTTFLEIIDKSHYENIWSKILAFYFSANHKHGLNKMLIKSLCDSYIEVSGKKDVQIDLNNIITYDVINEYPTDKSGRIDIVIKADTFIIGIENKVYADLYNDLEDYSSTIDSIAGNDMKKLKIVLSIYPIKFSTSSYNFVNIKYEQFLSSIRKNIGEFSVDANTKYLILFFDFIETIEKKLNLKKMIYNQPLVKFFQEKNEEIERIIKADISLKEEFDSQLYELNEFLESNKKKFEDKLNKKFEIENTGVYSEGGENVIYYNISYKKINLISCEVYIKNYKWSIGWLVQAETNKFDNKELIKKELSNNKYQLLLQPWNKIYDNVEELILNGCELINENEKLFS